MRLPLLCRALGAWAIVSAASAGYAAAPPKATPIAIVSPKNQAVVTRTVQLTAQTKTTKGLRQDPRIVTFEYSANGKTWRTIAAKGQSEDVLGLWKTSWDTSNLKFGKYFLRARAGTSRSTISVLVDKPPIVSVAATSSGAGVVVFVGATSKASSGAISEWRWDFGDGATATGPRVQHRYEDFRSPHHVSLAVTDTHGVSATKSLILLLNSELSELTLKDDDSCICKSIILRQKDDVLGPDGDGKKSWPEMDDIWDGKKLGPVSGNSGNDMDFVGFAFEIDAQVEGNPDECGEIQLIKRTAVRTDLTLDECKNLGGTWDNTAKTCTVHKKWKGASSDIRQDETKGLDVSTQKKCEAAGGKWDHANKKCTLFFPRDKEKYGPDTDGDDDKSGAYEREYGYKVHKDKHIRWADAPGFSYAGKDTEWIADFISLVRGTDGKYCYASFTVDLSLKKGKPKEELKELKTDKGVDKVPGVPAK
jgi:PKD repeat protein